MRKLLQEGRRDLLEIIRQMRPREYRDMALEYIMERDPKERSRLMRETIELLQAEIKMVTDFSIDGLQEVIENIDSDKLAKALSDKKMSELAQALDTEQVEQMAEALSDEQFEELVRRRQKRAEGNAAEPQN